MKVIVIQEEGRYGGPHKRMIDVAKGLKMTGIDCLLIFSSLNAEILKSKLANENVNYNLVRLHRLTKELNHFIFYCIFFVPEIYSLFKVIRKENANLVHVIGSSQWKGLLASKLAQVPVVWEVNDSKTSFFIKKIFDFLKCSLVKDFIAASKRSYSYYLKDSPKINYTIIQSPIDTNYFDISKVNDTKTRLPENKINIVNVGNISPVKGQHTIIEALKVLEQKDSSRKIHVSCIGRVWESQKEYYLNLKQKLKENDILNLDFLGGSDEIREHLSEANIYLCSSEFESSPIALWEAMSMGLPIITTNVGDVQEIIEYNKAGIVVPTKNPKKMAQAILKLISNPNLAQELGRNARLTAEREFDLKSCVEKHENYYHKVLESAY